MIWKYIFIIGMNYLTIGFCVGAVCMDRVYTRDVPTLYKRQAFLVLLWPVSPITLWIIKRGVYEKQN